MVVVKLWPFNASSEQKMVILGLDAAGKSTLFYRITKGELVNTLPTIGNAAKFDDLLLTLWLRLQC